MTRVDRPAVFRQLERWRSRHAEQGAVVVAEPIVEDSRGKAERASTRRVRAPVEVYRDQGRITDRGYVAAKALYEAWAFSAGVRDDDMPPGIARGHTPASLTDARLDALLRLRMGLRACRENARLVELVVCCEVPMRTACRALHRDHARAFRHLRDSLEDVADAFSLDHAHKG